MTLSVEGSNAAEIIKTIGMLKLLRSEPKESAKRKSFSTFKLRPEKENYIIKIFFLLNSGRQFLDRITFNVRSITRTPAGSHQVTISCCILHL